MEPIDIYRTAKLLMDQHGTSARVEAALKADACLDKGDLDGAAVWRSVIRALGELEAESGTVH